jgi:hypothetical protein
LKKAAVGVREPAARRALIQRPKFQTSTRAGAARGARADCPDVLHKALCYAAKGYEVRAVFSGKTSAARQTLIQRDSLKKGPLSRALYLFYWGTASQNIK